MARMNAPAASTETGPAGRQAPGFYRYAVGAIEVTAIHDGFAPRPLAGLVRNAGLGAVETALAEAFLPTDAVPITFTTLALQTAGRLVLIDAGYGDTGPPTAGRWMANFRAAGFDPAQVDTVIVSHFHPDHIGGLRLKDGTAVFPKAEVMVPAPEWAFWMDDGRMAQAPDALQANFRNARRVFGPIATEVRRYAWGEELVPGVTALAAPGHTPGHTAYAVASDSGRLLAASDIANHPALFVRNPDWQAAFDVDGDQAVATRRRMLDMAAAERMQLSFYHAPFPATGHVARDGPGYRFVPVQWTPAV